jgi:hypothetical protein
MKRKTDLKDRPSFRPGPDVDGAAMTTHHGTHHRKSKARSIAHRTLDTEEAVKDALCLALRNARTLIEDMQDRLVALLNQFDKVRPARVPLCIVE